MAQRAGDEGDLPDLDTAIEAKHTHASSLAGNPTSRKAAAKPCG
jgi:hypothetical protein